MTMFAVIGGSALVGLLTLVGALAAAASGTPRPAPPRRQSAPAGAAPPTIPPSAPPPPPPPGDDAEALARMLASETSAPAARLVIGWLTVQVAKRRGIGVHQLLTAGQGYGAQEREGKAFYASTARKATEETRALAQEILAGTVAPSAEIQRHRPGAWVEQSQGVSDERLLSLQTRWGEGIYGRIAGTRWFLYSKDAPVREKGQSAADVLAAVPTVQPIDRSVA